MAVHLSRGHLWAMAGPDKTFTVVTAFAWSPEGRTLALTGMTSTVSDKGIKPQAVLLLWDVRTRTFRPPVALTDMFLQAIAFSPGGDMLVTAGINNRGVVLRDPQSGQEKHVLKRH